MSITDKRKYKVVIPTAGIGSRLDTLTKYLNKSLISIENKPAITRIIDMFPNEAEFVIALGYKSELVKQFLSIAYSDRKFYYAEVSKYEGEGSGLGLTLLACEKYLQEPFVFCSCDTIVSEQIPYPDKNIAGYASRDNLSQYRTLSIKDDTVLQINEKGYFSDNVKAYIGLCCIKDFELFWKEMHNGKNESISTGESYALKKFADKNYCMQKNLHGLIQEMP